MSSGKDMSSTAQSGGHLGIGLVGTLKKWRPLSRSRSRSRHTEDDKPFPDGSRGAYILTTEELTAKSNNGSAPSRRYTLIQPGVAGSDGTFGKPYVKTVTRADELTELYRQIDPSKIPDPDAASFSAGVWNLLGPKSHEAEYPDWLVEIHERVAPDDAPAKSENVDKTEETESDAKAVDDETKASNSTTGGTQMPTVPIVELFETVFGNAVCAMPHGSKLSSTGVQGRLKYESELTKRTDCRFDIRPLDETTYLSLVADFAKQQRRKEPGESAEHSLASDQMDEGAGPEEGSQPISKALRHADFAGSTRVIARYNQAFDYSWLAEGNAGCGSRGGNTTCY